MKTFQSGWDKGYGEERARQELWLSVVWVEALADVPTSRDRGTAQQWRMFVVGVGGKTIPPELEGISVQDTGRVGVTTTSTRRHYQAVQGTTGRRH